MEPRWPGVDVSALEPLTIEAVIETSGPAVVSAAIMYRVSGQTAYLEAGMSSAGGDLYFGTIPAGEVTGTGLDYYIVAVLADQSVLGYPADDPEVNPIYLFVQTAGELAAGGAFFEDLRPAGDEADVLILSPEPRNIYLAEEVVVAVSLFNVTDLDAGTI